METFCEYSAEKFQLLIKRTWKGKGQEKRDGFEEVEEGGRGLALQISGTYCEP